MRRHLSGFRSAAERNAAYLAEGGDGGAELDAAGGVHRLGGQAEAVPLQLAGRRHLRQRHLHAVLRRPLQHPPPQRPAARRQPAEELRALPRPLHPGPQPPPPPRPEPQHAGVRRGLQALTRPQPRHQPPPAPAPAPEPELEPGGGLAAGRHGRPRPPPAGVRRSFVAPPGGQGEAAAPRSPEGSVGCGGRGSALARRRLAATPPPFCRSEALEKKAGKKNGAALGRSRVTEGRARARGRRRRPPLGPGPPPPPAGPPRGGARGSGRRRARSRSAARGCSRSRTAP